MPPAMPRRGLKVFFARASPAGMEMTALRPPGGTAPGEHVRQLVGYHPAGDPIDGRRAHRLVEAGEGDPAHAGAAVDLNAGRGRLLHPGEDQGAVGHVGVVPAVLADRAGGPAGAGDLLQQLGLHPDARRGIDAHGGEGAAQEECFRRALCRRRGAGARGVAAAQAVAADGDVVVQLGHGAPAFLWGMGNRGGLPQGGRLSLRAAGRKKALPKGEGPFLVPRAATLHLRVRSMEQRQVSWLALQPQTRLLSLTANGITSSSTLTVEVRLRRIFTGLPYYAAGRPHRVRSI